MVEMMSCLETIFPSRPHISYLHAGGCAACASTSDERSWRKCVYWHGNSSSPPIAGLDSGPGVVIYTIPTSAHPRPVGILYHYIGMYVLYLLWPLHPRYIDRPKRHSRQSHITAPSRLYLPGLREAQSFLSRWPITLMSLMLPA